MNHINQGTLVGAFILLIIVIIFSTTTWDVQETQTYTELVPYTYEQSLIRATQVRNFPWINEVTRAQFIIMNTDKTEGTFNLNYTFDNEIKTETRVKNVSIQSGEKKAVTIDSPLKGVSKVTLNVIPPNNPVQKQRTVTKKVHIWDYLWRIVIK